MVEFVKVNERFVLKFGYIFGFIVVGMKMNEKGVGVVVGKVKVGDIFQIV